MGRGGSGREEEARAALSAVLTAALRRTGLPCAPASRPGTAVGSGEPSEGRGWALRRFSLFSFFFSLRGQTTRLRWRLRPGQRPRPAAAFARNQTLAGPPRRRGRAASRVSQNSPRSSGALGRGVQSPRRRQRRPRGARRFRLDNFSLLFVSERCLSKQKLKSTTLSGGSLGSCVDEERS